MRRKLLTLALAAIALLAFALANGGWLSWSG
jgi:hypothetical protein